VKPLSVATFISNGETINHEICSFFENIRKKIPTAELLIYSDYLLPKEDIAADNIKVNVCPNMTKYKRILKSLDDAESAYILYLDNDITPDVDNLFELLENIQGETIDLAWGTIGVAGENGFIQKLIVIDKIVSHKIIRPTLWKLNLGISVPGQIFLADKTNFRNDLPRIDTVFDDLTIGVCARRNRYDVKMYPMKLGYEKPSANFKALLRQRARWAAGFCESVINNIGNKILPLVIIHGFAYHLLCFAVWAALVTLFMFNHAAALALWFALCIKISDFKAGLIFYAAAYSLIFPFIHLAWLACFLFYMTTRLPPGRKKGGAKMIPGITAGRDDPQKSGERYG
jgi:cellulose synthase/poly-beta-1,6-N-acetylglucosamine synthase-like glycosyltransferase